MSQNSSYFSVNVKVVSLDFRKLSKCIIFMQLTVQLNTIKSETRYSLLLNISYLRLKGVTEMTYSRGRNPGAQTMGVG